jgi:short-subunit dehydrogenase
MRTLYRGTTALITGASSGLGEEFARQFASRGADVVLVARRVDRLEKLAGELAAQHGITATALAFDLTRPGAGSALRSKLEQRGIRIQTLVNNAGFGSHGPFVSTPEDVIASQVQLNVASLVDLTRVFLPDLLEAGRGALVNIASNAAFQPTPWMAVYGASKAFVLSFTEAVAYESLNSGLSVLALSPGATRTEFFQVAGNKAVGRFQTPARVVDIAFNRLDRNKTPASVVTGLSNYLTARMTGFLPRALVLAMSGRLLKNT